MISSAADSNGSRQPEWMSPVSNLTNPVRQLRTVRHLEVCSAGDKIVFAGQNNAVEKQKNLRLLLNLHQIMSVQVSDGVQKEVLRAGNGSQCSKGDTITVHCTGNLAGPPLKKFWSTKDPGQEPFTFAVGVGQVITGWDEGCLTMCKGECSRITIRGDKGYGARGFPAWGITPNATLIFEIEILTINGQ